MTKIIVLLLFLGLLVTGGLAWAEETSSPASESDPAPPTTLPMGVHEVKDEQGKTYIVTTTGGLAETQNQAEEDRLRSWKMLEGLLIVINK